MKKLSFIIPLLIIIGAVVIWMIPSRSPVERAFDGALDAANSHDYARFGQYVDVKGLIKSYLNLAGQWDNSDNVNNSDEIEARIQYFIETDRIPDPDRFRKVISTHIAGKSAEALIALELRKYSIICTTSVMMRSSPDGKWQITRIDLWGLWNKCMESIQTKHSSPYAGSVPMENFTPAEMIRDILYDNNL